jgi:hypothetical protein
MVQNCYPGARPLRFIRGKPRHPLTFTWHL